MDWLLVLKVGCLISLVVNIFFVISVKERLRVRNEGFYSRGFKLYRSIYFMNDRRGIIVDVNFKFWVKVSIVVVFVLILVFFFGLKGVYVLSRFRDYW